MSKHLKRRIDRLENPGAEKYWVMTTMRPGESTDDAIAREAVGRNIDPAAIAAAWVWEPPPSVRLHVVDRGGYKKLEDLIGYKSIEDLLAMLPQS